MTPFSQFLQMEGCAWFNLIFLKIPLSIKIVKFIRQTSRGNVRMLLEVDVKIQSQDGDVIVQSAGIKFGVHNDVVDVALNVREELDVMIDVPFAESGAKVPVIVGPDAVSRGQNVTRRYEGAAADVDTLLLAGLFLQNGHLPGVFSELGLAIVEGRGLDATGYSLGVSGPALAVFGSAVADDVTRIAAHVTRAALEWSG